VRQTGTRISAGALHHLDAAAGSQPQARLCARAYHADRQRLYEGIDIGGETTGLITYMRTDGVQIDNSAITRRAGDRRGLRQRYVPDVPRQYQTKAKNAQEAHEAIRPTDLSRRPPRCAGAG